MGREADISKKRVLDTSKIAIEKTNECIRVVTEVRESVTDLIDKHEVLRAQTAKDVAALNGRASAASNWGEANETSLRNARLHLESQISALAHETERVKKACTVDREWLHDLERRTKDLQAAAPPSGFFARLKWFFTSLKDEPVLSVNSSFRQADGTDGLVAIVNDRGV